MARVFIDPGHGGDDNGAVRQYHEEDDYNLAIAFMLDYELRLRGIHTDLSREADRAIPLGDRVELARRFEADVFVSIHCDAFTDEQAHGFSTHVAPGAGAETALFAGHVHRQMQLALKGHRDRGLRESNFFVLRHCEKAGIPAVLVETEFISNPLTALFLKEPENQRTVARAIAAGVMAYLANREKE